ncbi:2-5-diamino-6-ribosylamino-4(3H)-pyrimidinone 5'-phosphate reductase [Penicillium bovifimosum]|uniref:2-5-diamino-6-ribosylamino-4(3H)-pyrimidinone 5'-phosphate reductase n=1 Tax=Penicillium bovifimosum TaxID=126998 RepID=A0A9W9H126_9EURO|nr:2-5-diamino-6-ribosylamino-4(3H)-pyrimidinone 5'-phosphate reductase [Penicillium bovifimosum]KAJ5135448.1 2-5-diamino-6-ribosylamino-4(3H)-pyrimidinone 5'-phosphate reductase [Penicillium bovifimosum]
MTTVLLSFSTLLLSGLAASQATRAIDGDFADPSIIETDDGYYAFASNAHGVNVQIANSSDFTAWDLMSGSDALPGPFPSWVASSPSIRAPDVIQRDDGKFVMYFSAASSEDASKHCIGAATAANATGPYVPEDKALVCPLDQGGAVDADGFEDDGVYYIVYKVGDDDAHASSVMLQELDSDAVTPVGDAIPLVIQHDQHATGDQHATDNHATGSDDVDDLGDDSEDTTDDSHMTGTESYRRDTSNIFSDDVDDLGGDSEDTTDDSHMTGGDPYRRDTSNIFSDDADDLGDDAEDTTDDSHMTGSDSYRRRDTSNIFSDDSETTEDDSIATRDVHATRDDNHATRDDHETRDDHATRDDAHATRDDAHATRDIHATRDNDETSDDSHRPIIESPSLAKIDGTYYLSFTSDIDGSDEYEVSYATASSITGPYIKAHGPDAELFDFDAADDHVTGAGGVDFSADGSKIVFHAFENGHDIEDGRAMFISDVHAT